jgi:Histone methylation protein DOT1
MSPSLETATTHETVNTQSPSPDSRPVHIKIMSAVRDLGWRSAPSGAILYALKCCRSFWYDLAHGISTHGKIPASKLDLAADLARYAQSYEASDTHCLRKLLRSLGIEYEKFEFVDLGAGKGRSMFVAAEFPFRRIWGSELSPSLSETARRNCKAFRSRIQACKDFRVICGDSAEFSFPKAPLVIYLFNPFGGLILSRVLSHLERSWQEHPRDLILVYHNSLHSQVIKSSPLFELVFSGTDKWDYRKLPHMVFRAKAAGRCRFEAGPSATGAMAGVKNPAYRGFPPHEVAYNVSAEGGQVARE